MGIRHKNIRRSIHRKIAEGPASGNFVLQRRISDSMLTLTRWPAMPSTGTGTDVETGILANLAWMEQDKSNGRLVIAAYQTSAGNAGVYYSDNGGNTWQSATLVGNTLPALTAVTARLRHFPGFGFVLDSGNTTASGRLFYSKDGVRWNSLTRPANTAIIPAVGNGYLHLCARGGAVLYSTPLAAISSAWTSSPTSNISPTWSNISISGMNFGALAGNGTSVMGSAGGTTTPSYFRRVTPAAAEIGPEFVGNFTSSTYYEQWSELLSRYVFGCGNNQIYYRPDNIVSGAGAVISGLPGLPAATFMGFDESADLNRLFVVGGTILSVLEFTPSGSNYSFVATPVTLPNQALDVVADVNPI